MPATHKDDTNHKNLYSKTDIFLVNFVSSGLAAALSKTATAPLERVKLILQTGALKSENPALKKHGLYQTVRYLVIKQGFLALWRGNTLTVAKAVPSQALLFSFQDFYRHIIFSNEPGLSKQKSTMYSLFAGGLASGTVIGITYPFYFCQNIVSSHVGKIESARFSNIKGCISETKSNVGHIGLYRGFCVTSIAVILNRALYFGMYEFLKQSSVKDGNSSMSRWISAQIASLVATSVSYPIETVGRLMIMGVFQQPRMKKSVWNHFKDTYQKEGLKSFFGGFYVNMLRSVSGAIVLVVHEDLFSFIIDMLNEAT